MTAAPRDVPSVVLICHEDDPVDTDGIAAWLASTFQLKGIVLLRDRPGALLRKLKAERRRVGWLRLADVILFRLLYQLRQAAKDAAWVKSKVEELRRTYPAALDSVPRLCTFHPNSAEVRCFIHALQPDFALARCKYILKPEIFSIPAKGTYVLHPGICPSYRNAHGCFWALVNRDLRRVGMTLLRVDSGIDTGPIYLQRSYDFDEASESHVVIQHRVVLENLGEIAQVLRALCEREVEPRSVNGENSRNWGQPWLSGYLRWQRELRAGAS